MTALNQQIDGNHYTKLKIQPVEYIHANNIPFIEGCIIKYITRWRDKGGIKDLDKAIHFINLLKELENEAVGNVHSDSVVPKHITKTSIGQWERVSDGSNVSWVLGS